MRALCIQLAFGGECREPNANSINLTAIAGKHSILHTDVHVPFIVRHPHMIKRGEQSHVITELLDLYPTLAELSGLASQRLHWPPASGKLLAESRAMFVILGLVFVRIVS